MAPYFQAQEFQRLELAAWLSSQGLQLFPVLLGNWAGNHPPDLQG